MLNKDLNFKEKNIKTSSVLKFWRVFKNRFYFYIFLIFSTNSL